MSTTQQQFGYLKRKLRAFPAIARASYEGARTIVVLPGLSFNTIDLRRIAALPVWDERLMYFVFYLRTAKTRVIYYSTDPMPQAYVDCYLDLAARSPAERVSMATRLTLRSLNDRRPQSLARKILERPAELDTLKALIASESETAYIRCYNATDDEKALAVALNIPLYALDSNLARFGTKSGGRKLFREAGLTPPPGIEHVGNRLAAVQALVTLIRTVGSRRYVVKFDASAAGRGNTIFHADRFLAEQRLSAAEPEERLSTALRRHLHRYSEPLFPSFSSQRYWREFEDEGGGVIEALIEGSRVRSPSVRFLLFPNGTLETITTHEQILKGKYGQAYAGGEYPAVRAYHNRLIEKGRRVGRLLAARGTMGSFAIDFVAAQFGGSRLWKLFPIEINLRKGGTSAPPEIARFMTDGSIRNGILHARGKQVFYFGSDVIDDPSFAALDPATLIQALQKSKLRFNPTTNRGVVLHMVSSLKPLSRFGATIIGTSRRDVQRQYHALIKFAQRLAKLVKR